MKQKWKCPECQAEGEVEIVPQPPIGEVMSLITAVATAHRLQSPDCPVTERPAGYVRIILYMKEAGQ